jgi:hypothetical protein
MQSSYLPSEIQELVFRINQKKDEYNKAIKNDREFKFVRPIYQELKALEKKYQQVIGMSSTASLACVQPHGA